MGQQSQQAIADKVDDCFMPCHKEQGDHAGQFGLAQFVAAHLFGLHKGGDEVVLRPCVPLGKHRLHIGHKGANVALALAQTDAVPAGGDNRLGPLMHLALVGRWNPQQLHDDPHGQGQGKIGDEFHAAVRPNPCQQLLGYRLDARSECFHAARGERLPHQRPQTGVVGWVGEEHVLANHLGEVAAEVGGGGR